MKKIYLSINEAVDHLRSLGLPISKSVMYRHTMERTVPFQRYGLKKIVFQKDDLEEWAKSRLTSSTSNEITKTVAESARRKETA